MNARITKAELVAQMTKLTDELIATRNENAQLRQLNAEWATQSRADRRTILKLKARLPALAPNSVDDFSARCRQYCEQNNCRSVPADVVKSWRNASH